MLEHLRNEMIVAFQIYNAKFGDFREFEWAYYCKARELYLRNACDLTGTKYVPLRETIDKGEGNN